MCLSPPEPTVNTDYTDFQREQNDSARADQQARQAEIDNGLAEIAAIFEGGTFTPITPTTGARGPDTGFYPGEFGPIPVAPVVGQPTQQPAWQPVSPPVTTPGVEPVTYGGMDPYLQQREKAQMDFYMPQLQTQFSDTTEDLTFALNDAGLLTSSVAGDRQADLTESFALEEGKILADIASDIAGQTSMMNQQRSSIENSLRASGDQSAAIDQSLASMATFAADQPTLDPMAPLFASIAQGIGAGFQGYQTGATVRSTRPAPLTTSYGRNVG